MPRATDVVIVGGGVIGCSIAYWLAKAGIKPLVLERDRLGSGASRATAGVVGPLWHVDHTHPEFFSLGLRSLDLFPGLASELTGSGVDPEFRRWGVLKLAFDQEEAEQLKSDLSWQNETGLGLRWLDAPEVRDLQEERNRPRIAYRGANAGSARRGAPLLAKTGCCSRRQAHGRDERQEARRGARVLILRSLSTSEPVHSLLAPGEVKGSA